MQKRAASALRQSMPLPSAAMRDSSCCSGVASSVSVRCPFSTTARQSRPVSGKPAGQDKMTMMWRLTAFASAKIG